MKTMERATKLQVQALWRGMNFNSDKDVSASKLLEAQQLVRAHLIMTWPCDRLATSAPRRGRGVRHGSGTPHEQLRRRRLTPFLQTHVLIFTALDVGYLVG